MRTNHLAWLLALCLLLAGCRKAPPPAPIVEPPSPTPTVEPDAPAPEGPAPLSLDRLTVEVVVDWEDADRILSSLEELSRLLGEALGEKACSIEEIAVTIGTAGGITAQALRDGGVDVAFLPNADLEELEEGTALPVLESPDLTLSVTSARADQRFCAVLPQALMETAAGQDFLEACYPGVTFAPAE